jgi:hypothetical protein
MGLRLATLGNERPLELLGVRLQGEADANWETVLRVVCPVAWPLGTLIPLVRPR